MIDIDQIKSSADIIAIVSSRIELHQRSGRYYGICPFHDEKTGSFTVFPEKKRWKCFGCGEQGDVLDFICRYYKCNLQEACRIIQPDTPSFQARRQRQEPTEEQKHKRLMDDMALWKEAVFDRMEPDRRQKILDYCIDHWKPWHRPEYLRLTVYLNWLRQIQRSKTFYQVYQKNILEYRKLKKVSFYRRFEDIKCEDELIELLKICIKIELAEHPQAKQ